MTIANEYKAKNLHYYGWIPIKKTQRTEGIGSGLVLVSSCVAQNSFCEVGIAQSKRTMRLHLISLFI
jgi:hypothetical protein